jgi:hypothetical protein
VGCPPHLLTRVQHSPPLCVLQQQSTSATLTVSMIETSPSARAIQSTALSDRLAQLASALPIEKITKVNVKAITKTLHIERACLVALYIPVARNHCLGMCERVPCLACEVLGGTKRTWVGLFDHAVRDKAGATAGSTHTKRWRRRCGRPLPVIATNNRHPILPTVA